LALGVSPFDPDYGPYLYVANYNPTLTGFKVATGGGLTQLTGSPYAAPTGQSASAAVVDPTGRFVYYANYNNAGAGSVSGFKLDALDGHLVPMAGSPFAAGNGPSAIAMDPTGRFVYVTNSYGNSVSAYTLDRITGALTQLDADAGTTGIQDFPCGPGPYRVAVHPDGRFLYVTNGLNSTVSLFSIATTTGALTRIDADAGTAGVQDFPVARASDVAIHPSGRSVYFTQTGNLNRVLTYSIDGATGVFTPVGTFQPTGSNPVAITVDAAGRYAYVTNQGSNDVSVYQIDPATGALTPVAGSPFAVAGATSPVAVLVHGTVQ
jgi:YVTN family beta-propeller protein